MKKKLFDLISDFIKKSERVIAITHKPKEHEYRQMALTTGIGMALLGLLGFTITMVAYWLR